MPSNYITLMQAIKETPGADRSILVAAIMTDKISSQQKTPPYMVKLADIQALVKVQLSIISATDFIYRFTNDEQLAIASVPQGLVLWLRLLSFSYIELGNSEVVNSLNSLVTAGILTLPRKIAILTP